MPSTTAGASEHGGDAVGGRPATRELRADVGQALQRADQKLRQADRGDQLSDADVSRRGQPPGDKRDEHEERAA